jgi:RNA-directed DNA polymerase
VNRHKSQVVNVHALEYLGFKFKGIRVYWSDQSFADFKHRLKGVTSRSWGVSMEYRLTRTHVLLETVAQTPHAHPKAPGIGDR